jgi:hypothetical protein
VSASAVEGDKAGDGTVVGAFHICWKDAAGELVIFEVIGDALTTNALARARFVGAGATLRILGLIALHHYSSLLK